MNCLLVLSLAVLGASAAPCGLNLNVVPGCVPALPGRTFVAQTPVVENPTAVFPPILPSTSVSESCHCMKTIVRPQIRNEVITVPSVDRIVRFVTSPEVEAVSVNLGGNTRNIQIPTCTEGVVAPVSGFVGGVSGVVAPVATQVIGGNYGFGGVVGTTGCGCGFGGVVGTTGCVCGPAIVA